MLFFSKETKHVTALMRIVFWLGILACITIGIVFFNPPPKFGLTDYYPLNITLGATLLLCAVSMISLMQGKREGGFAAIGFVAVATIGFVFSSILSFETEEAIEMLVGFLVITLWPTLSTMYGEKRYTFQNINLRNEMLLHGSTLGKVLFCVLYVMLLLMLLFCGIGICL